MRKALASILLVAAVACGDDSQEPEVTACTAETGSVTAAVDVTAAPVFSWDPDCDAAWLLVEGVIEGDVWFIETSPRARTPAAPAWLRSPLNNATLIPLALYQGRLDEYRKLLMECKEDLHCFYDKAELLSRS